LEDAWLLIERLSHDYGPAAHMVISMRVAIGEPARLGTVRDLELSRGQERCCRVVGRTRFDAPKATTRLIVVLSLV
jgi:hypothetical protein